MNEEAEKFKEFLDQSNLEICLPGMYNPSHSVVIRAFDNYIDTGIDVSKEHMELTHLSWKMESFYNSTLDDYFRNYPPIKEEIQLLTSCLLGDTFWHHSNWWEFNQLEKYIKEVNKYYVLWSGYEKRRQRANYHISKKDVRERIYKKCGYKCVKCGQDDKTLFHIDHIIPVIKGGGNEDENLQVLCVACNCSKGGR